ncbi:MAG: cysteine desulfurase [Deltaproteobacteria bacterium]|nr:cysteine desulfurase [Deltaproteobacteria bacterium]
MIEAPRDDREAAALAYDVALVRADFPGLNQQIHDKPLCYLDNAATAQKPQAVLDAIAHAYTWDCANVHRGVHVLSVRATQAQEAARESARRFLGAGHADEVLFTGGTTAGINLVAQTWGRANLGAGDEILITWMEHHSNIVPWQLLCQQTGARLVVAEVDDEGRLRLDDFERKLSPRTKLVSVVHISNALGTINPVAEIVAMAQAVGARVLVDGAQSAPHGGVDVRALGCDFFACSGHKIYGPTGIGLLYGKAELLAEMPPWMGGGDMIETVSFEGTTFARPPARFEAGTPHIAGAIGLGAALEYVMARGPQAIAAHERALHAYGVDALGEVPGLRLIGPRTDNGGVLSFVLDGVHPHDAGTVLDHEGIAVRVGHHCTQPLMKRFGVPATIRASLAMYSTRDDVDRLAQGLRKVVEFFA